MADQSIDLRPKTVNVSVYRGDAWAIPVTLTGVNLTGATIAAQLRDRPDATDATDLDVAETDLAGGLFHFGQQAAQDEGYYDVEVTPSGGLPRTYIRGRLFVTADVTRP